jgi:hypothetical protein
MDIFVLPCILYTVGGVGELYQRRSTFFVIVSLFRPTFHQDWGERERLVAASL